MTFDGGQERFCTSNLAAQIQEHSFTREYEPSYMGRLRQESGTVDAPIGRSKSDRKKMSVTFMNTPKKQSRIMRC